MEHKAKELFDKAVEKLGEANDELFRPEEDVVSYSVCKNAQYAIENYLKGFLLSKGVDPIEFNTIESLFEQCKLINTNFAKIDLSDISCKSHTIDVRYCNEVSKVSSCFDAADELDTFLRKEKIIA
jgi:HEPN domain-containing protein